MFFKCLPTLKNFIFSLSWCLRICILMQFLWNGKIDFLLSAVYAFITVCFSHTPARVVCQVKERNRTNPPFFSIPFWIGIMMFLHYLEINTSFLIVDLPFFWSMGDALSSFCESSWCRLCNNVSVALCRRSATQEAWEGCFSLKCLSLMGTVNEIKYASCLGQIAASPRLRRDRP